MKISALCASALILALSLAVPPAHASARAPAEKPAAFENSPGYSKIDLRFRDTWREAIERGDRSAQFECMLKTARPATADDRAVLKSAGFEYRTAAGSIFTGTVSAASLPAVANLDFVQAMELATPLSPKARTK